VNQLAVKLPTINCKLPTDQGVSHPDEKIGKGVSFAGLRCAPVPMKDRY